ncbi:MAG: beta-N-acetylhexosaminidase [Sulfobacillus sp.]
MTPRDIGQLLTVGFDGLQASPALLAAIRQGRVGGVVLFGRNVRDAVQLRHLTAELQEAAQLGGHPPLFISIDQEGGSVRRLRDTFVPLPSAMAMAASGQTEAAARLVHLSALEMMGLGINQNYAPDLDVNNNPLNPVIGIRSFGEDPDSVARWGQLYVEAMQSAGMIATGKHFPGHGDTDQDSHTSLPLVAHQRPRLEAVELLPFRVAIAAGIRAIMSAHVVFPAFDPVPHRPATVSPTILGHLMRQELGFSGLLVTDCMEMAAIKKGIGTAEGTFLAIEAGADQVLISHTTTLQDASFERLTRGAIQGELSPTRLREALRNVAHTKSLIGQSSSMVDRELALQLASGIWESAVAGVGALERLPIADPITLVTFHNTQRTPADDLGAAHASPLKQFLGPQVHNHFTLGQSPSATDIQTVHTAAKGMPLVVALDNAVQHPDQMHVLNRAWTDGLVVALALSSPYDLRRIPVGSIGLTAFDPSTEAQQALAKALHGEISVAARWPITLEVRNR